MEAPGDGARRYGQHLGGLAHRDAHEVVHHDRLADVVGQGLDGVAQDAGVHFAEKPRLGVFIHCGCDGLVVRCLGGARLAPVVLGVAVDENLAHPAEEGGTGNEGIDVGDRLGEGAVYQFLGIALVGAKPTREGLQTRLAFAFKPFRSFFGMDADFIYEGHRRWLGKTPPLNSVCPLNYYYD